MPDVHLEDTIAAIATPPGEGGIGVVRISGPEAIKIASEMFRKNSPAITKDQFVGAGSPRPLKGAETAPLRKKNEAAKKHGGLLAMTKAELNQFPSHLAQLGYIHDQNGEIIDQVLLTVFRKPKSYTAEDVVEISGHGGSRVVQKILGRVLSLGARHAEPGEFTKRAFLNGRIDLTQAEAVLDLIRAKTDKSVEVALRQLDGKLSREIHSIKDELMKIYAHVEAYLDFPDEHLEVYSNQDFKLKFERVASHLKTLINSFKQGEILREGASVILCGRPNVGKSSLLNVLLDRDRALVSEVPGTTRDTLEESVELGGILVRLVDTAGLWSSPNPLDQAAMERTKRYFKEGDLILWILDANEGVREDDLKIFESIRDKKTVAVMNKIDLVPFPNPGGSESNPSEPRRFGAAGNGTNCLDICFVSAKTREGIEQLEKKISGLILEHELGQESVLITCLRHKHALEQSLAALEKSSAAFLRRESLEFIALDLKQALDALKELVGEIYTEDLLDVIFSEFCIGK